MPERPGAWDLLDRDRDPVIADVVAIDERIDHFRSLAEAMREQSGRLARIASGESLKGAYADELRGSAGEVSRDLTQVVGRYEAVVTALSQFRPAVDAALSGSLAALDDAVDASGASRQAEAMPEAAPATDAELTPEQEQANADRADAVSAAAERVAAAKARLEDVLARFDAAGADAARIIRSGFGDGLTDSWVDRFVAGFTKFLKILVKVLTYVGIALAVLAIFIPGVGPLIAGAVLAGVALVAEVALMALGEGSALDLAMAIVGVVTLGGSKLFGPAIKSGFRAGLQSLRGGRGAPISRPRTGTPDATPAPRPGTPETTPTPRSGTPEATPTPRPATPERPPGVPHDATPTPHPDLGINNTFRIGEHSFIKNGVVYTPVRNLTGFKGVTNDRVGHYLDNGPRDPSVKPPTERSGWEGLYIAERPRDGMGYAQYSDEGEAIGGQVLRYDLNQPATVATMPREVGEAAEGGRLLGLEGGHLLDSMGQQKLIFRNPLETNDFEIAVPWNLAGGGTLTPHAVVRMKNWTAIYEGPE